MPLASGQGLGFRRLLAAPHPWSSALYGREAMRTDSLTDQSEGDEHDAGSSAHSECWQRSVTHSSPASPFCSARCAHLCRQLWAQLERAVLKPCLCQSMARNPLLVRPLPVSDRAWPEHRGQLGHDLKPAHLKLLVCVLYRLRKLQLVCVRHYTCRQANTPVTSSACKACRTVRRHAKDPQRVTLHVEQLFPALEELSGSPLARSLDT